MAVEVVSIQVCKLEAALEKLLAPDTGEWDRAEEAVVPIDPTPLDRLPSAYVQVSWRDRPRGAIGEVRVRAAAGDGGLAVRLDWAALRPSRLISDVNVYPDACAMLFPADGREAEFDSDGESEASGAGVALAGRDGSSLRGDGDGDRHGGARQGAPGAGAGPVVGGSLAGGAGGSAGSRWDSAAEGIRAAGGLCGVVGCSAGARGSQVVLAAALRAAALMGGGGKR